jgi:hypothetical protein
VNQQQQQYLRWMSEFQEELSGKSFFFFLSFKQLCVVLALHLEDPGKKTKYRFSTWVYVGILEIGIFLCGENYHLCTDF